MQANNNKLVSKLLLTFMITVFTLNFVMLSLNGVITPLNEVSIDDEDNAIENLRSSAFWTNFTTIHIKNNWSSIKDYEWCSGSGTWGDPYIIENMTIDNMQEGSGIIIEDSEDYFILNNCTVFNSSLTGTNASIVLNNVTNGLLEDIYLHSSYYGLWMNLTVNVTVNDRRISGNSKDAIYLKESENNTITNILMKNNDGHGIYLKDSDNNTISYNQIEYNDLYGIYLDVDSDRNWVAENYVGYNKYDCIEKDDEDRCEECRYIIDNGDDNRIKNNDCVGACVETPKYGELAEAPFAIPGYNLALICISVAIVPILIYFKKHQNK